MHRALLVALVLTLFAPAAGVAGVTTKEIEEALTCQCGCGLTVHSCNHLSCGSAIPLKREVLELVNAGGERPEILSRFREKYGEKILAAPVAEGFNLTAWVLPFLVIAAGAIALLFTVRRWTVPQADTGPTAPSSDHLSTADRRLLDAELRRKND